MIYLDNMPKEYRIKFLPIDRVIQAVEGDNLLEVAMKAGVHINASCGGNGACGKCRVRVLDGSVQSAPCSVLSDEEYGMGFRLACVSFINTDASIEIPLESQIDRSILRKQSVRDDKGTAVLIEKLVDENKFEPLVDKHYLELPVPNLNDNVSDSTRLARGMIAGKDGDGPVISIDILKGLGKVLRDAHWRVTATVALSGRLSEVVLVEEGNRESAHFAIAVDVGTTTVCAQLIDCGSGKGPVVLAESADYNGQISYGEDVISRIMYARKKGGLKKLQEVVVSTINGLIEEVIGEASIGAVDISHIIVAGNTTMMHLLFGIDPKNIMLDPYTPLATVFAPISARRIGLKLGEHARLYTMPGVASYIGGDIVSGVAISGMTESDEVSLFMDIGTNGELVLGNKQWLMCASCSAGPAFEGGGIQFGMRAAPGAIEKVRINPVSFEPMILTVGRAKPLGICGSGLIDIVAELFMAGIIDQNGKFALRRQTPRVRKGASGYEYVLCFAGETKNDRDIVITEVDLDNVMRTKAAVYAGCRVLLENGGLAFNDLGMVIIAGGFGHSIDIEKAVAIGLLPEIPMDRFRFIGNGSLGGARAASVSRGLFEKAGAVARSMTNIELSNNTQFMDEFMAAMFLPHTDERAFPEVMRVLKTGDGL